MWRHYDVSGVTLLQGASGQRVAGCLEPSWRATQIILISSINAKCIIIRILELNYEKRCVKGHPTFWKGNLS